jgi:hypothetical protein
MTDAEKLAADARARAIEALRRARNGEVSLLLSECEAENMPEGAGLSRVAITPEELAERLAAQAAQAADPSRTGHH